MKRGFISLPNGHLHICSAGQGPWLLCLHESPRSGRQFAEEMQQWRQSFTILAPDTPGYGLSDHLQNNDPGIADFADAIANLLIALQAPPVVVLGRHTGALIAAELAARHPKRVHALLLQGYPIPSPDSRALYLERYFQEPNLDWSGAYAIWWWYRLREQHIHWPWFAQGQSRARAMPPSPADLHLRYIEWLESGPHYISAYLPAFREDSLQRLAHVHCPMIFCSDASDSLHGTRLRLPENCRHEELSADPALRSGELLALLRELSIGISGINQPKVNIPQATGRYYLAQDDARIHVREYNPAQQASEPTILLLPPWPGSHRDVAELASLLARKRRVIVVDLPGQGDGAPLSAEMQTPDSLLAHMSNALEKAISYLGLERPHVIAHQGSARILQYLCTTRRNQFGRIAMLAPRMSPQDKTSEFRCGDMMMENGAHLMQIWHDLRQAELFFPADSSHPDQALAAGRSLSPQILWRRFIGAVKHTHIHSMVLQAGRQFGEQRADADMLVLDNDDKGLQPFSSHCLTEILCDDSPEAAANRLSAFLNLAPSSFGFEPNIR